MFALFRNRKKQKPVAIKNDEQDRIAKDIVVKCIRLQQHWAAFIQHHSERLPGKLKVIVLSLFCLCGGKFSLILIARSLMSNHAISFRVNQVKTPLHIGKSLDEKTKAIAIVTKEEYEKILAFRKYMDSLEGSPSGKKLYNNILISHPGLIDSITLVENIYKTQIKK